MTGALALTKEQAAWDQAGCLGFRSLRDFLKTFPAGGLAQEAQQYLAFVDGISAIAAGDKVPDFVIPFEALGPRWQVWQERRPETGIIGYFQTKGTASLLTLFPGCFAFSLDEQGLPIAPTGHSSLLAFQTAGAPFEFLNSMVITTNPGEIVCFAVVEGMGLVHLEGQAMVTMPNGVEVKLE